MVHKTRAFLSRLLDLVFRRSRAERLDEEIASHLAALAGEFEARGMSPADAALAARKSFGNVDRIRMLHSDQRGWPLLETWAFELRAAARVLLRDRSFTAGVVLVLALGLAVNTSIFTIVNGMTWRTLPVPDGERILHVSSESVRGRREGMYTSYADFNDRRKASVTLSDMAAYATAAMNVGDSERPADRLAGAFVSAHLFRLLQVQPILGRDFTESDDRPGASPVAILGHHIWTARYNADASLIGREIRIGGEPITVIGVMPPGFQFPLRGDLWRPIAQMPSFDPTSRDQRRFDAVARLEPGITLEQAQAEMTAIAASLAQQHPASNADVGARVQPFTHAFVAPPPQAQEPLVMMIAAAVVLLIACANGASLLLARANRRAREMTLRATLGASRARIVQQLLLEALLTSAAAALLGLLFSVIAVQFFAREAVELNLPYWIAFEFDSRVFLNVAAACLGTAVAFGLLPALQLSRSNAQDILKDGGRGVIGGRRGRRWASVLLAGEVALTVMLLAAGALLLQRNAALGSDDEALDLDRLFTAQVAVPAGKYATLEQQRTLYRSLEAQLNDPTAFAAATVSSARPFVDATTWQLRFEHEPPATERAPIVQSVAITPSYFRTLGITLRAGRELTESDALPAREAVVVNDHFVREYLRDGNPLGRRIQLAEPRSKDFEGGRWYTIVGVSPSVRQRPMSRPAPLVYVPLGLEEVRTLAITVRSTSDATATATTLRDAVRAVDADVAAYGIMSLRKLSSLSRWTARLVSVVLAIFAVIAVVLSAAALYGVTSYGFAHRTSEIGLRMAMGARHSQIAWVLLRSTLASAVFGIAIGLAGASAVAQMIGRALLQGATTNFLVLGGIAALLVVVVSAACYVPTRRAVRLDPVAALRHE